MNNKKKQPNENSWENSNQKIIANYPFEKKQNVVTSTSSNEYGVTGRNIDFLFNNENSKKAEKSSEEKLEELFKIELQKQFLQGLKGGMFVVSQTVLEKLNDTSKPLMDRISDIKRYCKVSISQKKDDKQAE